MEMVEPNVMGALIFAGLASVASMGILVLSGAFPLNTRPELKSLIGGVLVVANVVLLGALIYAAYHFGRMELRWTSMVIVAGFAFLFVPGLFNIWPSKWRDGMGGLLTMGAGLAATLGLLSLTSA